MIPNLIKYISTKLNDTLSIFLDALRTSTTLQRGATVNGRTESRARQLYSLPRGRVNFASARHKKRLHDDSKNRTGDLTHTVTSPPRCHRKQKHTEYPKEAGKEIGSKRSNKYWSFRRVHTKWTLLCLASKDYQSFLFCLSGSVKIKRLRLWIATKHIKPTCLQATKERTKVSRISPFSYDATNTQKWVCPIGFPINRFAKCLHR